MSETLERLARAICRADWLEMIPEDSEQELRDLTEANWPAFVGAAKAVLQELREPDEAMREAGVQVLKRFQEAHAPMGRAKATFRAMIDAILGDPQP